MSNKITHIFTGFLVGNLGLDEDCNTCVPESVQAYTNEVKAAIEAEYPGVEVDVDWQDASGSLPCTLETSVTGGTAGDESDAIQLVNDIKQRVYERGTFYRKIECA